MTHRAPAYLKEMKVECKAYLALAYKLDHILKNSENGFGFGFGGYYGSLNIVVNILACSVPY